LGLKLLAYLAEAFIRIVLTGTDVEGHADDEPDRPDQEQGGDDGSEDGESRHFVFSLKNENRGAMKDRSPIQGMGWI
jgi:hypothetical protein